MELSRGTPPGALTASVVSIPGVCAGVAQYLALRLGERNAFPHTSPALLDALARVTGRSITARHVEGIAGRWRPWWTHATAHLWLSGQPPSLTALP